MNEKLEQLIPQYVNNKTEMESYKKLCDNENKEIKSIMLDAELPEYKTASYKATCTVSERESINEEMLLDILKHSTDDRAVVLSSPDFGIVKLKEYIDFDALEKAIYDNKIPKEVLLEMDKARETKEIVTLKVSKLKQKKEE